MNQKAKKEEIVQNVCCTLWPNVVEAYLQQEYQLLNKKAEISAFDGKIVQKKITLSNNLKARSGEIYSMCQTIPNSSKLSIKEDKRKIVFVKV